MLCIHGDITSLAQHDISLPENFNSTQCVHQATYNTPTSRKISMLHTVCPPINLQYTPKQENRNTTHCVSTKRLTIHPKARKSQCYTLCVHQTTYISYNSINTPQSRKTTILHTVCPPSNLHHVGRRGEAKLAWLCNVRWGPPPADGESVHTQTTQTICLHTNNSQNLSTHKQLIESVHTQTTHRICLHTNNS